MSNTSAVTSEDSTMEGAFLKYFPLFRGGTHSKLRAKLITYYLLLITHYKAPEGLGEQ